MAPTASKIHLAPTPFPATTPCKLLLTAAEGQAKRLLGKTTGQCQTPESSSGAKQGWKKCISVKLQAEGLVNGAGVG